MRDILTVLSSLPKGESISREGLMLETGCSDRTNRNRIRKLRKEGHQIVNGFNGGYRMAKDSAEWNMFVERENRRAKHTFKRFAGVADGQMKIV